MPHDVEHAPLCMSYSDGKGYVNSLKHFEMTMEDSNIVTQCTHECLPNCEEVIYNYVMDTTYIEAYELCNDNADLREVIIFALNFNHMLFYLYQFQDGPWLMEYN